MGEQMMQGPERTASGVLWPSASRHHGLHEQYSDCDGSPPCTPVEAPAFTIEINYQPGGAPYLTSGMFQPGWKYLLRYKNKNDQVVIKFRYGYDTEEDARLAAESHADSIAKSMLPTRTYTYIPKVEA